jgi:serine/threonine protein kinase
LAPAAPGPLPAGYRLHEFTIEATLGEGGFGIVYRAQDELLGRQVALKEYMPGSLALRRQDYGITLRSERHRESYELGLRSFINEARLLASFDHPSLVKVYRFWEEQGTAYMVMPYYQGPTLKSWQAEQRAAQAPGATEDWWRERLPALLDALQLMHDAQCYHRDIAPDNILLVGARLWPVLLDFGAARRVLTDATQALTVILKPGYAPIEQYAEVPSLKQGAWTDVYALSAVLYNAVTGQTPPPAVGRMMSDTCQPAAVRGAGRYSDDFLRGIDAGLAVLPHNRPQSLAELRALLGLAAPTADPLRTVAATTQHRSSQSAPAAAAQSPLSVELPTVAEVAPAAQAASASVAAHGRTVTQSVPDLSVPLQPSAAAPAPDGRSPATSDDRATVVLPAWPAAPVVPVVAPAVAEVALQVTPSATVVPVEPTPAPQSQGRTASVLTVPAASAQTPAPTSAPAARRFALPVLAGGAAVVVAAVAWWGLRPPSAPSVTSGPVKTAAAPVMPDTAAPASATTPGATAAAPVPQASTNRPAYSPVAALVELVALADRSIQVDARADKATLRIEKDKLQFRVRSSQAGHVYAVYVSSDGRELQLLFPNGLDKNNRIAANSEMVLPRPGWTFTASGPVGTDHIAVLVSPSPRDFTAAGARTPSGDILATFDAELARTLWTRSDGYRSAFAGEAQCDDKPALPCNAAYGAALIKVDEVR